jgi:uncharacterized membrane protein YgaE (UPF0421/DUF939 family)
VVVRNLWPLLQQTAAATVAWLIANNVLDHDDPFFAPVSALVALNTSLGERGLNALRLLQGVLLGIVIGELVLLALGGGYGTLALATFVALVVARALGDARIMLAQSAVSTILTVAVADGEVGLDRLTDALVGTGVALVFSQVLFSPQPLRLLRRVESSALSTMAEALDSAAQALEGDEALAARSIDAQRDLRDQLSELARIRRASTRVARHSLVWRTQMAPVVQEQEDAAHLDLLGSSFLLLTRTALETSDADRKRISPSVRALSKTLADLAVRPGEREARQHAADRSLEILHEMRAIRQAPDPDLTAALNAARIAVSDLMCFVGVDPDEARAATRPEVREQHDLEVPARPQARQPPFRSARRWLSQRFRRSGKPATKSRVGSGSPTT